MNFNATLIGQSITFIVFVWFCMRFIWPPIMNALAERKATIAEGLAAAERGKHEQELAKKRAAETLQEAKQQAADIISRAEKRAANIVEEAKKDAVEEGNRMKVAAQAEIEREAESCPGSAAWPGRGNRHGRCSTHSQARAGRLGQR